MKGQQTICDRFKTVRCIPQFFLEVSSCSMFVPLLRSWNTGLRIDQNPCIPFPSCPRYPPKCLSSSLSFASHKVPFLLPPLCLFTFTFLSHAVLSHALLSPLSLPPSHILLHHMSVHACISCRHSLIFLALAHYHDDKYHGYRVA